MGHIFWFVAIHLAMRRKLAADVTWVQVATHLRPFLQRFSESGVQRPCQGWICQKQALDAEDLAHGSLEAHAEGGLEHLLGFIDGEADDQVGNDDAHLLWYLGCGNAP